jgi:protein-S-isoprenylcysteine O-methyltransferase Ste14
VSPSALFGACWAAWAVSWFAAARWSSPPILRPAAAAVSLSHLLIGGGIFLTIPHASAWLRAARLWDVGRSGAYALAPLTIPGFLFTWWARVHLGCLWSGTVTLKESHVVIDTGPYALVRHPIYTGLLEASLVSAIATGTAASVVGFVLVILGVWLKARLEERLLSSELRSDSYGAYRRRVPMFLPGWPMTAGMK